MNDTAKTKSQLLAELADLRRRLSQIEAARDAPRAVEATPPVPGVRCAHPEHRLLNSVIESIRFPLYVIDIETFEIVLANSAACPTDVPRGITCHSFTHRRNAPCDDAEGPCPIEEVRRNKQPLVVEHVHYDQRGVPRYYEIHAFPILDEAGNVTQMIEYNVDVTERTRVADELRNHEHSLEILVEQLERSNAELQEVASLAAHDMRSPIAGVASAAALLREMLEHKLNDDEKAILDILMRGADKPTQIITSVYRCAQIDAEEISPKPVDLNRLVAELSAVQLRAEIERTHGRIRVPEPLHAVLGDEVQILELTQNLIANGLKYHRQGVKPEVTIRSREVGEYWIRIEVEDNGIGIRADDREKVFGMFKRLDDACGEEGLGIGLASCKRVVERHGGRIDVHSTYGVGSTFSVELPRA
jgi:signal transduction histidine kinase